LKNVLSLQDEVAQDITEQIRVTLTPKERSALVQVHTVDPEAYDAALRGWYWLWNSSTLEDGRKALDYFQKAIAKDPSYAPAYAGLADLVLMAGVGRYLPRNEALTKARAAAFKALALDPSLAEAHVALGLIKYWGDWDWAGTEAEYKQALALNPSGAKTHSLYSGYLLAMGRLEEAMKEIQRARDLDPFSFDANQWLGQVLYHARRYDDALRQIRRTMEMFPDRVYLYSDIADVYEQKKMFAEAFAARQKSLALTLTKPNLEALADAYKHAGYSGYLLKQTQILEQAPQQHALYQWAYLAHLYAMLGDEAHAISCLERDYENHSDGILYATTAPELDSIRSSPRFRELVSRMRFPQPTSDKN
jgi:tetratricopeptide (TPR) repeat protein